MKYKYLAILITLLFVFSCFNGVFAHPGHGTEYVEEVSSSDSSPAQSAPVYSSGGASSQSSGSSQSAAPSSSGSGSSASSGSGGSSGGSSSSSGSSASSGQSSANAGTAGSDTTNSANISNNTSEVNTSADVQPANEDSQLFSMTNIIIMLAALVIGFLAVILISKFFK